MTVYEAIDKIEDYLTTLGFNVETNPYSDFEILKGSNPRPVILLEEGTTEFEVAARGQILKQTHTIDMTVMVNADKKRPYREYKTEVSETAQKVLDKIIEMSLRSLIRIEVKDQLGNEFMMGSLKVSGITITLKVH